MQSPFKPTNEMEEQIDMHQLGESIVKVLKTIFDPEIPVDIYELGLIYDVFVNEDREVKILMTLTSPNCPVAETLPMEVEEKIKSIDMVKDVEIELTFDPPWDREMMSEEAKLELGML
ncbi:MAG TPA: SUF system Fe-S cluster assembly protein [Flavobacterium sp.]|nr:SUF system Fe-S cluster assembly protein [Flavobacterium sp.]